MNAQERELHAAQLDIVYEQTWTGVFGGIGVALVFVTILWEAFPQDSLVIWCVVLITAYVLRGSLYLAYRRRIDNADIKRWNYVHRTATTLTSAIWGISCFLFVSASDPIHLMVIVMWIAGLSAASTSAYSVHLPSLLAFFLPLVVPVTVYLLAMGGRLQIGIALGLIAYCLVSLRAVLAINRAMMSSLRLNNALSTRWRSAARQNTSYMKYLGGTRWQGHPIAIMLMNHLPLMASCAT
jgi:hypothetical protein